MAFMDANCGQNKEQTGTGKSRNKETMASALIHPFLNTSNDHAYAPCTSPCSLGVSLDQEAGFQLHTARFSQ